MMASQASAAGTVANFHLIVLSCLATSVAQAFEYVSSVLSRKAAAASAATLFEGGFLQTFSGTHVRFSLGLVWNYFAGSLEIH